MRWAEASSPGLRHPHPGIQALLGRRPEIRGMLVAGASEPGRQGDASCWLQERPKGQVCLPWAVPGGRLASSPHLFPKCLASSFPCTTSPWT